MYYLLTKVSLTAILVALISEVSKRFSLLGAIFASIPLTSVLAMIWLYHESKDIKKVIDLSQDIFYLVIPSLVFFIALPLLLKKGVSFYPSMFISLGIMSFFYYLMTLILKKAGLV
ncbi:MAG: hypothetical protein C0601_02890 [Candidatus Muiribacterium halophilum]|uniref:DUF3147 domain-containing protein n=1 Tax=Muiribacterium halophilum TaxID=2053465 RepID=A0A2N5ZKA9_MUIH1|nr:MAG: hypothetical protein C0601_02890 [Candidatus Muirbacterium halophilum]